MTGVVLALGLAALAQGAAVEPAEPAATTNAAPQQEAAVDDVAGRDLCGDRRLCLQAGEAALWPRLALRFGYELQSPDPDVRFIGDNDGMRLDQMRFGFESTWSGVVSARLRLDAARLLPGRLPNEPGGPVSAALVDAYLAFIPSPWLGVVVGRSRMPTDREGGAERTTLVWASRSVASGGVSAGRGFALEGFSVNRELGVVVGSAEPSLGALSLGYALGVSNGDTGVVSGDDGALPASALRLSVGWDDLVHVGVGAHWRPRRVGDVPAQHDESDAGGFVEVWARPLGFDLYAVVHGAQRTFDSVFPDPTDPNRTATGFGATAWIVAEEPFGLHLFGARVGYRASFVDPLVALPSAPLVENALGVRLEPDFVQGVPLAFILDGTLLSELDGQGVRGSSARVFALVQLDL